MSKAAPQPPKQNWFKAFAIAVVIIQVPTNIFVLYRLDHQETMNREQVRFDTTVAAKVFGYDATRRTNTMVTPYYHAP